MPRKPPAKPKPGTPEFRKQARERHAANKAGFITTDPKEPFKGSRFREKVSTGRDMDALRIRSPGFYEAGKAQIRRALKKKPAKKKGK